MIIDRTDLYVLNKIGFVWVDGIKVEVEPKNIGFLDKLIKLGEF